MPTEPRRRRASFRRTVVLGFGLSAGLLVAAPVRIAIDPRAAPRVAYGAARLARALRAVGRSAEIERTRTPTAPAAGGRLVIVGDEHQPALERLIREGEVKLQPGGPGEQGFQLDTCPGGVVAVTGGDDSGALYGCLELARRVRVARGLPTRLHFADAPVFKLRGPCIGMQKPYILPGRHVYEYPYTPKLFPFFYSKTFWRGYLDFLVDNRMNTLTLWNGHPFASLVKLKDYPFALEVPEATYKKNVAMMHYITREADRRGIWVIQMFYNIIVSKPFAEHYGIPTQLHAPTPLVADYTRKSIAAFIKEYPNVGLMVCLGEALQGGQNQLEWCTKVILPGVKDGMREAGLTHEPPVIIRTHAMDARLVMPAAFKVYHNLITMTKYTGESLTTAHVRGAWQRLHLAMARLGGIHMINVHLLANLEPFRYGAQAFIQRCMQDAHDHLGALGLHLYPLSYWNWPYAPDQTTPRLLQYKRDWIWYQAWARYAWNPDINPRADRRYWIGQIAARYGTDQAAADILDAYNNSGMVAPLLVRRFGITDGNRQTLSLGMTLDELVNPQKYHPFPTLWKSEAPPGERLGEYAEKEWKHEPHAGETPPKVIREVLTYSRKAVAEIDAAAPGVRRDRTEYKRLRNDIHCIQAMAQNYAAKANAALCVLRYRYSHDIADMERAERYLAASLVHYRTLVALTRNTYSYANSMQTSQRRIPVTGGVDGKPAYYLWSQMLPVYEKELATFRQKVARLKAEDGEATARRLQPTAFKLPGHGLAGSIRPRDRQRGITEKA